MDVLLSAISNDGRIASTVHRERHRPYISGISAVSTSGQRAGVILAADNFLKPADYNRPASA